MSKNIRDYFIYLVPIITFGALLVVLNATSPLKSGPAGILLVFILTYLFLASALYAMLVLAFSLVRHFVGLNRAVKKRKLYYLTSIIALGPVFLLALNSIGQLDLKDFILVLLLVVVACFYITRRF